MIKFKYKGNVEIGAISNDYREQCLYWDQEDELKKFKDEFVLPEGVIYLDGNSLGLDQRNLGCRSAYYFPRMGRRSDQ